MRIFRLVTAAGTLALVALVMGLGGTSLAAKIVAAFILLFGALQWLALGVLGRQFEE